MKDWRVKHGHKPFNGKPSSEYSTWSSMKARCYNKNQRFYMRYGGRGITVCDQWRNDFLVFLSDVGRKPYPSAVLDRIDNDGNYAPGNVRWIDRLTSARNTSGNLNITIDGITRCAAEWGAISGVSRNVISLRFHKFGWRGQKLLKPTRSYQKVSA